MNADASNNERFAWFGPALFTVVLIAVCYVFWLVLF